MKSKFHMLTVAAAMLCAMLGSAQAQFRVGVVVDHFSVLQGEPIRAHVTITNDSLYPLVVGASASNAETVSVDFRVTRKDQDSPERLNKKVFANGLSLEPGDGITLDVDIAEWVNMYKMGRYRISMIWTIGGKSYESGQELVDVIGGIELKSVTKEVPFSDGSRRTYSLRYWARDGAEHLFLRADSEDGSTRYGVFELGELVRVFDPTITVDRFGSLVIVHQMGVGQYRRTEFKSTVEGVKLVTWSDVDQSGSPAASK